MSSLSLIDSVIDDDDEFCPLCIEEFDLSDKNFKPCPCGYQICQFCYNNIKTQNEEGRCPNCRRGYDESTIQYKIPDVEEFKADLALKHRKAAAAKKKEAEKREIEASSRKNLAGVRVVQKNLVYVIGLNPTIRDENQLLQTLRGREYFGQYGEIEKIVVSKAKPGGNPNQGIGVYVTFSRKVDAAMCINAVDGSGNGDRVLRAQYGTTKYCSSFLRNEQCNNRNCTFLHETGEDSDSYSRQDLSSMNTISTQRPNLPPTPSHVRSAQPIAHPMRRQPSKDDSISSRTGIPDGPALPSTASWANKDVAIHRTRRTSLTGSQASINSPRPASVNAATPVEEPKRAEKPSPISQEAPQSISQVDPQSPAPQPRPRRAPQPPKLPSPFDSLLKDINSPDFKFSFSTAELSAEEVKLINDYPSFIDPYGGVKRRAMREKVEQERLSREHELLQSVAAEEDSREAGSLQLGGEPEEVNPPRNRQTRESHGAIQPPSQQDTADNSTVGSPVSATSHQFQGLNLAGRSLTPLQQQQLMLLKSAGNQQAGLADPLSSAGLDQAAQVRQGLAQNQMAQFNALQAAQNRQSSRFSFANEVGSKNMPNARMLGQMQSSSPNPLSAPSPQHGLAASGFYASGVQGPPPGLKTAGTPPISGGGMFAQGHGFTSGLGGNGGKQDPTPELMRELLRGRTGTNVGGLQGQEAAKREFMFPFLQQHNTPPPMTPVNGLLSSFYGPQAGVMPDSGGPQKQKKKGKKHRHANTSSGGGGVVDLADPSILQARMHQVGANATAGQALYGSQGQVNEDFPPLGDQSKDRRPVDSFGFLKSQLPGESAARAGTPSLPPGLPLPHAHPSSSVFQEHNSSKPSSPVPILPPGLTPSISRLNSPSQSRVDSPSRLLSPELTVGGPLTSSRVKDASQISFGSPVQKSASKPRTQRKSEFNIGADFKDSPAKATHQSQPISATTKGSPLDFGSPLPLSVKTEQVPPPGSVSVIGSRPDTPQTMASRLSDSPATRQPRVLRVVETPKPATPPIVSVPSVPASIAGGTRSRSRRQSISSTSIPDTPADVGWEADYYPSTSASRANSPPASTRIGSAPVRSMTKSQVKKERKQKAKEAEAKKVETAHVNEEPVQAPIMGRKRKTKKAPTATVSTADAPAASAPEKASPVKPAIVSPVKAEPKVDTTTKKVKAKEIKPVREPTPPPVEEPPVQKEMPVEPWRSNNTVGQLVKDSEALGRAIKDLFVERTKPLHELLAEMHKSGELNLNKTSLFNPTNLSQRTDMKCTAEDYDYLQCPNELTEEDRKTLLRGEPVRIGDDFLKTRCLITPRGCVLRHLEPEEEEQYLELEKNMASISDPFMIGDDTSNPSGGLEALFANPEKFNICWVDDMPTRLGATSPSSSLEAAESVIPPNVLSAMEADSTRNHDWAVANSAEFLNTTPAAVRSFAAVTAQHMLGNPGMVSTNPTLDDVAGLTNEELKDLSGRSQKDLELTRKEMDSLDKKFAALLRRNKKLQQQALNFSAGSEL